MGRQAKHLPPIKQCLVNTMIEYDLDPVEFRLLSSVPLRGTNEWNEREVLRQRCECKCLSWYPLEEDNGTS